MEEENQSSKITKFLSATLDLFDAREVLVEVQNSRGLPSFQIVGLPSQEIKESKDRIKAALGSTDFTFPPSKITVNLSPSDETKRGSHFDLPIALGIFFAKKKLCIEDIAIFGELGLDGTCKNTYQLFALVLSLATEKNIKKFIVPQESLPLLELIPNIELLGVNCLQEAIQSLSEKNPPFETSKNSFENAKVCQIGLEKYYYKEDFLLDFSDMKGQERAKRALLIAAAGFHNLMMEGSPGCGKSMGAKRLRYILPPLSSNEILQINKIASLDKNEALFEPLRPFRSPHHSSSRSSIFGGGTSSASIGEISLAHNGILFLDEVTFFSKSVLESLREPLENHRIDISRVHSKIRYETDFLFVAALNPCPCGNLFNTQKECKCNEIEIKRYKSRISGPIMDRIDLYVQMDESASNDRSSVTSKQMFDQVLVAFQRQKSRAQKRLNSRMSEAEIDTLCKLSDGLEVIFNKAIDTFSLSHRAQNKILKVARTIADLDNCEEIKKEHLLEALSFRRRS